MSRPEGLPVPVRQASECVVQVGVIEDGFEGIPRLDEGEALNEAALPVSGTCRVRQTAAGHGIAPREGVIRGHVLQASPQNDKGIGEDVLGRI